MRKLHSKFLFSTILVLLATRIELGYQTFWINADGIYWSPAIWTLAGLLTCVFAAFQLNERKTIPSSSVAPTVFLNGFFSKKWVNIAIFSLVFLYAAYFIGQQLQAIFIKYPIDPLVSDGIPSLKMYVQRFLKGEFVYTQMYFPSWSFFPTYLPLMWFPYTISEIINIDYRWIAYFFFLIILILWNRRLLKQSLCFEEAFFKMLIPFIIIWYFIKETEYVFGHAVELTPISYYLLLALSLGSTRIWWAAIPIVGCLLSRYAFSFWLPVYLIILWSEWGFKKTFRMGLIVLTGILLLYILPFLSRDWSIISKGVEAYNLAIIGQWQVQPWQAEGTMPHHLSQGLSFAIYFYNFFPDLTVMERLHLNKIAHLLVSLSTAIFLLFAYFWAKKKYTNFNLRLFLLISLKFYLIIFYSFMYIPFSYLYQLPLFLSIPIIYEITLIKAVD